jgi:hypothetical protein
VRFAPYTATATHTGTPETPIRLTVLVPPGTIDGPIRVSTFNDVVGEGADLSDTSFLVPPPEVDCFPLDHARSITLRLRRHLVARGRVSSIEDPAFTDCVASVPVRIQRRVSGRWGTVGRTTTTDTGVYRKRIKNRPGKYRSVGPPIDSSLASVSAPSHPFEGTTSRLFERVSYASRGTGRRYPTLSA